MQENGRQLLLQSNGADCYLLGTQGCADLGVPQNRFPAWQAEAMYLNLTFKGTTRKNDWFAHPFTKLKQVAPHRGKQLQKKKKRSNLNFCVGAMGDEAAQLIINAFVDGLATGRTLPLLSKSGVTSSTVQMDKARTALSIRANGRMQRVPLESIMQISVGAENAVDFDLHLHDLCVALLLEDEHTIYAFEFEDDEARDTFALCLGMFVDQRRSETEAEEPLPVIESSS
eukprot:s5984_g2.t1